MHPYARCKPPIGISTTATDLAGPLTNDPSLVSFLTLNSSLQTCQSHHTTHSHHHHHQRSSSSSPTRYQYGRSGGDVPPPQLQQRSRTDGPTAVTTRFKHDDDDGDHHNDNNTTTTLLNRSYLNFGESEDGLELPPPLPPLARRRNNNVGVALPLVEAHHHHHHDLTADTRRIWKLSRPSTRFFILRVLAFLPLPSILAIIYTCTGQSVLRLRDSLVSLSLSSSSSTTSYNYYYLLRRLPSLLTLFTNNTNQSNLDLLDSNFIHVSLGSTAAAAATGGIVLTIPILIFVWLLSFLAAFLGRLADSSRDDDDDDCLPARFRPLNLKQRPYPMSSQVTTAATGGTKFKFSKSQAAGAAALDLDALRVPTSTLRPLQPLPLLSVSSPSGAAVASSSGGRGGGGFFESTNRTNFNPPTAAAAAAASATSAQQPPLLPTTPLLEPPPHFSSLPPASSSKKYFISRLLHLPRRTPATVQAAAAASQWQQQQQPSSSSHVPRSRPRTSPNKRQRCQTLAWIIHPLIITIFLLLFLLIGTLSAPLGVACLHNYTVISTSTVSHQTRRKYLTTSDAAIASLLGTVILNCALALLCLSGWIGWTIGVRSAWKGERENIVRIKRALEGLRLSR